ncbi:MAG: cytochrome bd ubiquinol oxidase subunit [Myxococcaceae bacterium]|nr:cytochrome bd ubiquinol oxidase subunit [Myxococcaceae bacterium]
MHGSTDQFWQSRPSMHELVLAVMLLSAMLYALFGGADFGVGLIEPFVPASERKRIDVAIAPVWEANHVWLVLLATISFVAFPRLYSTATAYLHIPLSLVLLGIVARGSAFTFRHYDPSPGALVGWYTLAFRAGSLLTPLFLGITLAATAGGGLRSDLGAGFYAVYVAPWNTWFGWATGSFVCALFAFEGAALLAAENAASALTLPFARLARNAHLCTMLSSGAVFVAAYVERLAWFEQLIHSALAIGSLIAVVLLAPVIALGFARGKPWLVRVATGAQLTAILLGFFAAQFPALLRMRGGDLTISAAAAPDATFRSLLVAITIGLCAIGPGMVYLIRVYKGGKPEVSAD